MTEDTTHTEVWAYAGLRPSGSTSFVHCWFRTDNNDFFHMKQRLSHVSVGGQIAVTVTAEDKVYTAGPNGPRTLASRFDDQSRITEWAAADAAAHASRNDLALQRKSQKVEPLDHILAPLQRLADSLTRPQRRALAVHILAALNL
jgi:hypothetical protein